MYLKTAVNKNDIGHDYHYCNENNKDNNIEICVRTTYRYCSFVLVDLSTFFAVLAVAVAYVAADDIAAVALAPSIVGMISKPI